MDNSTNYEHTSTKQESSAAELLNTTEDMELEERASTKPMKEEESLFIAQADDIDEMDQESQAKEEDSLPATKLTEPSERSCTKPFEDKEMALIARSPDIIKVDQDSKAKENKSLSTTKVTEPDEQTSDKSVDDEKSAFIPDNIIEMGDPEITTREGDGDNGSSFCACCK